MVANNRYIGHHMHAFEMVTLCERQAETKTEDEGLHLPPIEHALLLLARRVQRCRAPNAKQHTYWPENLIQVRAVILQRHGFVHKDKSRIETEHTYKLSQRRRF